MAKKKELKTDKITLFWSGIGALLLLTFLVSYYFAEGPAEDEIKLVIDYGDGERRSFVTTHRAGISAWDMLQQANAVYAISLSVDNHFKPKTIGEKENGEDGKAWRFYINGRPTEEEPFNRELSGGEVILFKFE